MLTDAVHSQNIGRVFPWAVCADSGFSTRPAESSRSGIFRWVMGLLFVAAFVPAVHASDAAMAGSEVVLPDAVRRALHANLDPNLLTQQRACRFGAIGGSRRHPCDARHLEVQRT